MQLDRHLGQRRQRERLLPHLHSRSALNLQRQLSVALAVPRRQVVHRPARQLLLHLLLVSDSQPLHRLPLRRQLPLRR